MAESYRSKITRQDQLDNIAEGKEPNAPRPPKGQTGPPYATPKPAQVSEEPLKSPKPSEPAKVQQSGADEYERVMGKLSRGEKLSPAEQKLLQ